jgi:hypothetical protein
VVKGWLKYLELAGTNEEDRHKIDVGPYLWMKAMDPSYNGPLRQEAADEAKTRQSSKPGDLPSKPGDLPSTPPEPVHHAVDRLWVEPMADFRWI